MSPGRSERHGFEYYRHGTLSLYAALNVKTGKVHGKTRRSSDEFVAFLDEVMDLCAPNQAVHLIADISPLTKRPRCLASSRHTPQ
jgi:hypothetical protein